MNELEIEFQSNLETETKSELKINVKAKDKESLKSIAENIVKFSGGELIEINEQTGEATISVGGASQANIALELARNTQHCFYIRPSEEGLDIEEFECPPCEEGAITNLPEKYFMLKDGRVIEKRGKSTYLVYVCKIKSKK